MDISKFYFSTEFWKQINWLKPLQNHKKQLDAWDDTKCLLFLNLVENHYNNGSGVSLLAKISPFEIQLFSTEEFYKEHGWNHIQLHPMAEPNGASGSPWGAKWNLAQADQSGGHVPKKYVVDLSIDRAYKKGDLPLLMNVMCDMKVSSDIILGTWKIICNRKLSICNHQAAQ